MAKKATKFNCLSIFKLSEFVRSFVTWHSNGTYNPVFLSLPTSLIFAAFKRSSVEYTRIFSFLLLTQLTVGKSDFE